jgi:flagellar hook-associated protein 1 FlgK
MSLSTALSIAQSALRTTSAQTSVVSRNVSEAQNPDYTRRYALVTSTAPGARSVSVQRAANELLFKSNLKALASLEGQTTLYDGMERLGVAVNGVDNATSAASAIGKLQEALQIYSSSPSNPNLAENTIDAARDLVRTLNDGTQAIQDFRSDMDSEIEAAVGELNELLKQFQAANEEVVKGTHSGSDVTDSLDKRDALLKKISGIIGISTFTRADNDMVIMTTDGATLFETVPRAVTFQRQSFYSPGTTGNAVYVDGIPVSAASGGSTDAAGRLPAMLQLRDDVTVTIQSQLDEIARGLVNAFAETDPTAANPPRAGLFTWSGGPALPAAGTISTGLAGTIALNPLFDSDAGGNPSRLRDGGANGAAYVHNTSGDASFSDLLNSYYDKLEAPIPFDPDAGITTTQSVAAYSASAVGWFEGVRQAASDAADTKEALATRTAETLSNATGVNVDTELSLLIDLENTYQASARLISAVDEMLAALMDAVR